MGADVGEKAIKAVSRWMQRDEWREPFLVVYEAHLGAPCEDYGIHPEDLEDEIGYDFASIAVSCAVDDFFTCQFDDKGNLIDDYLKRRGWKESAPVKSYLAAMRDSLMSLYEVTDVAPGRHLWVQDLMRGGNPVRVDDRSISESTAPWDILALRLLTVRNKTYAAPGVLHFPREKAGGLPDALWSEFQKGIEIVYEELGANGDGGPLPEGEVEAAKLQGMAPLLTRFWLEGVFDSMQAPAPRMVNTDGEELVFYTARFAVASSARDAVAGILDAMEGFLADDDTGRYWSWLETGPAAKPKKKQPRGKEREISLRSTDSSGLTLLGSVELAPDALFFTTNSYERTQRGVVLLMEELGDLVGDPEFECNEIGDFDPAREETRPPPAEPPLASAEVEEILRQTLDDHYRSILTEPIPMLGDRTPRQAARSKAGRAMLVEWLKLLENNEARRARQDGQTPYESTWMWKELGLSVQRK